MDIGDAKLKLSIEGAEEAKAKLQDLGNSVQDMSGAFKKAGLALTGFAVAITGALAATVAAYAQEEKGIIRLRVAMQNVGLDYDANKASIEGLINTLQQKTAVADSAQRDSLASLIRITRDTTKAFDLLQLAMDVAVGTDRDLSSATTLLMYALSGNWGMLERYIPAIKAASSEEEKWMMLRRLFAGQAEEYGKSLAGQFALLKENIGDLAESIGQILAPTVNKLVGFLSSLVEKLKELPGPLKTAGVVITGLVGVFAGLTGSMLLVVTYVPKIVTAIKAMSVAITTRYIPALIAVITKTWAWVAAQVVALALMGPKGWIILAAGAAIAAGALYGLVKATQALIGGLSETDDALADTIAAVEEAGYEVTKLTEAEQKLVAAKEKLADKSKGVTASLEEENRILEEQIATLREAGYEVTKLTDAFKDMGINAKWLVSVEDQAAKIIGETNKAIRDQEIASFYAANRKRGLADVAKALGLAEEELKASLQGANRGLDDQGILAYVAAHEKEGLEKIADDLGMSERKLKRILDEANASLEKQGDIAAGSAGWSVGAGIAPLPAFPHGGIVTKPIIAKIGEVPEMILPLRTAMASLTASFPRLNLADFGTKAPTRLVASGKAPAMSLDETLRAPNVTNYNYKIELHTPALMGNDAEARQWARTLLDYMRQDQRRKGPITI